MDYYSVIKRTHDTTRVNLENIIPSKKKQPTVTKGHILCDSNNMQGREQRERVRESQVDSVLSVEPDAGLSLMTLRS